MFDTLLWPSILCLVASSSILDNIFFWLYRLMPGGRKLANLKANCQSSSIRSLQNAVRGYRNGSSSSNSGTHAISSLLTIRPLYHYPHPNLPVFTTMAFEALFLSYLLCALVLQHVNIYKMNVHVVDFYLVWFIAIFLSRRVVWHILRQVLSSEMLYTVKYFLILFTKGTLLILLVSGFAWLSWKLIQQNSIQNCLFLCYPLVMYIFTFGFTLDPQGSKVMLKLSPHQELGPLSQLQLLRTSLLDKGVMVNGNANGELPEPQPCSLPPDAVRYEAECLRTDFNLRIKQVLFQSLLCAYYVGFIPMKFSEQHYVYYDLWWACQHTLFVWLSSLLMLMMFMLPLNYCDALHQCALHLGGWERYPCGHRDTPHVWSALTVWPHGVLVRHGKLLYRALGIHNVAIPGDSHHGRFFFMFESPLRLINWMATVLLLLVLYQLFIVTRSHSWHQLLSVSGLLIFNYLTIYRVFRDRWALQAVIRERTGT